MGFSHGNAGEMSSVAQLVSEVVRSLHELSFSRETGCPHQDCRAIGDTRF
jgi:hypothetical protein